MLVILKISIQRKSSLILFYAWMGKYREQAWQQRPAFRFFNMFSPVIL